MMTPSRALLSSRSSIAARAFAPSKPKDGGVLEKTSTAGMSARTAKNDGAPAKASGSISLQTHYVVSKNWTECAARRFWIG